MRTLMPITAGRIDRMREEMGISAANEILKNAMAGLSGYFFAMENHRTFGTPNTIVTSVVSWDEYGIAHRQEPQWMIDATEFAASLGIEVETNNEQDHEEARERAQALRKIMAKAKYG